MTLEYFLVLGSNHRPARHLRLACARLHAMFGIAACAPAVRTRSEDGVRYVNAAVLLRSALEPCALRDAVHAIEAEAGRTRGGNVVTLDIDVVAGRVPGGAWQVHKPDDFQRHYVQELLARLSE